MRPTRLFPLFLGFFTSVSPTFAFIPASDASFVYDGRIDARDPAGPVIIWQASRVSFEFEGDSLEFHFSDANGQNYFDATIDGETTIVEVTAGAAPIGASFSNLGEGRHRLVLLKRNEAHSGHVRFRGVTLAKGAGLFPAKLSVERLRFQFIGDSITAGACNEDGADDQWENRRTHNAAKSYAAMTAEALEADHRNNAVSGMGISIGWVEMKAGEIWDRLYPHPSSPRDDLGKWIPHVVFVNLGENDCSYPAANGLPFPATYSERYGELVQAIRKSWPDSQIVLLRGGMSGGARNEHLRDAWQSAVGRLEGEDARITHFVFKHHAELHPRVADHRAMADELIAWLREQSFIRR